MQLSFSETCQGKVTKSGALFRISITPFTHAAYKGNSDPWRTMFRNRI